MSRNTGTDLMKRIQSAIVRTGRARVLRSNTGVFRRIDSETHVRCGLGNGSPDLVGVLRGGRCFCLEVKDGTGRMGPDQRRWHDVARRWGVFVCVVRSVPESLAALERAASGLDQ
jgi:hypothetical protein